MIGIRLRYMGPVPHIAKRELNKILAKAFEAAGIYWWTNYRPKHFTKAGAREYGYAPRAGEGGRVGRGGFKGSYTGRKLKKFGHAQPLVYTGKSRSLAGMRDVRYTSKRVRIVINAPGLNLKPKGGTIDMRAEMTAISVREAIELIKVYNREVEKQLAGITSSETKKLA